MPLLELEFNCLCLFAYDEQDGDVHVLMPATHHHEKHVVRMFHRSFDKEGEKERGRDFEGWALELGDPSSKAETNLVPPTNPPQGTRLVNLNEIAGATVDPTLLRDEPDERVAARVTLRSGRVTRLVSEANWKIGGNVVALAHQVTWQMQGVAHKLDWKRLTAPEDQDPPLASLKELDTEDDLGYRIRIFHVTENSLPPNSGAALQPEQMKHHFRALYEMLGVQPDADMLPEFKSKPADGVNCGAGQAPVKPTGT